MQPRPNCFALVKHGHKIQAKQNRWEPEFHPPARIVSPFRISPIADGQNFLVHVYKS